MKNEEKKNNRQNEKSALAERIVQNIKQLRIEKGITQEVLADALNVDTAVISNIEKGKRDLKVKELEKIANCFGEQVHYLFSYPKRYVDSNIANDVTEDKVSITFEVSRKKRDYLLHLVMDKEQE